MGQVLQKSATIQAPKSKLGLGLGLYFNIKLSDRWYLHPEAIPKYPTGVKKFPFYSLGDPVLDSLFQPAEITRKIKNITVPVLIRYRVYKLLFVEAGPQIGLRTKAKDEFKTGELSYENNIEDQITRFDAGLVFGINQRFSAKISSLAIGLRYYAGLTDIDKLTAGSQQNGVWQLLISIPVGASKEKNNGGAQ